MASATKRPLTEDAHNAFLTSIQPCTAVISEDLSVRLQNIGSRVRRSVHEGYTTQRFTGATPTPYPSPVKPPATPSGGTSVFRSSNDTLIEIFSSPTRGTVPSTPSPKKRSHIEVDEDEISGPPEDVDMGDAGMESDDEPIIFILGANTTRPIRPLRKSTSRRTKRSPPLNVSQNVTNYSGDTFAPVPATHQNENEFLDWFSHPF
ncbi:hypothetical protein BD410DRAFT_780381 [Rickenella mellea]|uniref:Uncharacterized protein n=1 Tax=Rickenella mellea TaxID=50990 RepID=A0A4R5XFD0_9AGAM|nr:hypothetical protein BD410DRAFT_780381 [Rickenella mellea]